jgi:hypothetical protein
MRNHSPGIIKTGGLEPTVTLSESIPTNADLVTYAGWLGTGRLLVA